MFKNFLISSQVHLEKNALSEAAWILSEYCNIDDFKVKMLPVGGLGLLSVENAFDIPESIIERINLLHNSDGIHYCVKIIPLENFDLISNEKMLDWIEENKLRIEPDESWKLTINKRHSALKSKSLITEIASKIERTVNLKHPDKIIQIEIIGKFIGLAVLKPFQIIQLSHLIKEKVIEEESEIENDV